jgi:hypothetical protein
MDSVGHLVLDLTDAEGQPAQEPDCVLQFLRVDDAAVARADHVQFPPSHRFSLPAFPQERNLRCAVTPSLYKIVQSDFFTINDGEQREEGVIVARDPRHWQPTFTPWNSLPPQFTPLKSTLEQKFVKLKHGPDVGVVTPTLYDEKMTSSPALQLAKMALLNLFAVLSAQQDPIGKRAWFDFVKRILVVDQERFVGAVDPRLFDVINRIASDLGTFKREGFFPGDVSQHTDNIPSNFRLTAPMVSVKCRYGVGNVQFTMAKGTGADGADGECVLLDCDMDEHSNLLLHGGDFVKHAFTGGTHPIDIHEYVVHEQEGVNLGYELRPRSEEPLPAAVKPADRTPTRSGRVGRTPTLKPSGH